MILSAEDLAASLRSPSPPLLLDVRLKEDYDAGHIEGAKSNCVFEVAFGQRMKDMAPDTATPVVVYGPGPGSHESRTAADKLARLGYSQVSDFRGGLEAAALHGIAIVGRAPPPPPPPSMHGVFPVDCENSIVEWTGRNLLNKHSGKIRLASGFLQFEDGLFTGGEFLLDMDSLSCDDLAGSPLHDVLIGHLKNEDFFDVPNHPTASILVTEATTVPGATPGSPNVSIVADLTLRGETHPVEFMAAAGLTDGGKPAAQASFSVDRTRWGAIYGSGKFFQRLAMHLVHDLVDIQVKVVAR